MEVTVIIPVYNAAAFIKNAVMSAISQNEVKEIILINDGSTDESLSIINDLIKSHQLVKLYCHQNGINKGRSASRNLGIKKATMPFIAFLDADDFFLENRFKNDAFLFDNNPDIEGVYNAIGSHFYRSIVLDELTEDLMTVLKPIPSDFLFESLLSNKNGFFSIDGLTIKASVFEKTGLFTEKLMVAEDTEMFLKMSLKCKLIAGILDKPLAIRGVHDMNVFNRTDLYLEYRPRMYQSLLHWSIKEKVSLKRLDIQLKWLWHFRYKLNNNLFTDVCYWFKLNFKQPRLLFSVLSIKYFPLIRLRKVLFPSIFR
jgi:glycosyltransferase involved in cell wall biosynthesis